MERGLHVIFFSILHIVFSMIVIALSGLKINVITNTQGKKRTVWVGMAISWLILVVVSSIRMNSGSDYRNYWIIYNWSPYYKSIENIIGKHGINSGLYVIGFKLKEYITSVYNGKSPLEQNMLFILVALLSYTIMFRQIKRRSVNPRVSIAIYMLFGFYLISNNLLKQQIAMSFFLIAFYEYKDRKYIRYFILCALGAVFHFTIIIPAILLPTFIKYQVSKRDHYILIGLFIVLSLGLPFYSRYLNAITLLLGVSEKYLDNFSRYAFDTRRIIYELGMLVMYSFIYSVCRKNANKSNDDVQSLYLRMIGIGLIINAFSLDFWLLIRISHYFYQFVIFLVPNMLETIEIEKKKLKQYMMIAVVFAAFFAAFSGENVYYNYHTVFNTEMTPATLEEYIQLYE